MKKKMALTGVAAALTGSLLTYQLVEEPAGPARVYAQDQQYVSLTFAPLVKKALPAVVNVKSEVQATRTRSNRRTPQLPPGLPPGFEEFFGFGDPQQPPRRGGGLGSGVIVSSDGYILTNNHVVEDATSVTVTTQDRREFQAKVIGTDPPTDIAVLKIEGKGLPTLPISDSGKVEVGDLAIAIGNPFDIGQTVTMGIISATGRSVGMSPGNYEDFIQTDAAINPGNSGGALVNTNGQLIGINTAIISRTGGNQGIGFAIPINMARGIMDQLVKNGKVVRGYMGAYIQDITPDLARAFKLPSATGAAITRVDPGTPAEKAGMRAGDVVTEVNGEPVADANSLRLRIAATAPGTTIKLTVHRAEGPTQLVVTLGTLPSDVAGGPAQQGPSGQAASGLEGIQVEELTSDAADALQLPAGTRGVVVSRVDPSSAAAQAGLRRGDVIQQVNRKPVSSVAEFQQALGEGDQPVLLLVNRGGGTRFVVVEPRQQ